MLSDILWLTHVMIQVLLSVYEWYIMTNTCDDIGVVECIWVIYYNINTSTFGIYELFSFLIISCVIIKRNTDSNSILSIKVISNMVSVIPLWKVTSSLMIEMRSSSKSHQVWWQLWDHHRSHIKYDDSYEIIIKVISNMMIVMKSSSKSYQVWWQWWQWWDHHHSHIKYDDSDEIIIKVTSSMMTVMRIA
jgi:hypothetical protein